MANFWIISDTHFGGKNNSKSWEDNITRWIDGFIVPFFKDNVKEGDVLVHLGDVFDNRQSVGLSAMSIAVSFFEKMSELFSQVYVLCGNHDAYNKNSNDITSLDCIRYIPKVNVIKTPQRISVLGRKISFIPWIESVKEVKCHIDNAFDSDLVFCHADFGGCTMNASGTKSESQLEVPDVSKIYSGHIHHSQRYGRVTYVGSPYHTSQNDRGNKKGVWRIDSETLSDEFYENTFSPQYARFDYTKVENLTFREFKEMCKNKFVEVSVDGEVLSRVFFKRVLTYIKEDDNIKDLVFVPSAEKSADVRKIVTMSECVSLDDMLDRYIDDVLVCGDGVKTNVRKISKKLING